MLLLNPWTFWNIWYDEYFLLLEKLSSSSMIPLSAAFRPNFLTAFKTPLIHSFFSTYILFHRISSVAPFSFPFTRFFSDAAPQDQILHLSSIPIYKLPTDMKKYSRGICGFLGIRKLSGGIFLPFFFSLFLSIILSLYLYFSTPLFLYLFFSVSHFLPKSQFLFSSLLP